MRFHDLRHTAATLPLGKGVNSKIVSEMLGHASVAIALDVYSHVMPHMQQPAAQVMDDTLGNQEA
jgi:integrase